LFFKKEIAMDKNKRLATVGSLLILLPILVYATFIFSKPQNVLVLIWVGAGTILTALAGLVLMLIGVERHNRNKDSS
jgi:hypothetical protein